MFTLFIAKTVYAQSDKHAIQYNDCHVHIVNFFQEGENLKNLILSMDRHKIHHSIILGIPVAKKWSASEHKKPRYFLGDDAPLYWYSATDHILAYKYNNLPIDQQQRLHPFISGFNPTDKNAVTYIENLLTMYPNLWKGIGEIFTRHDDLTALTEGEKPKANHEALTAVYTLAARYQLPVLIHSNITSKRERGWLYVKEMEEILSQHTKTRFIWAHAGTSGPINRWQTDTDTDLVDVLQRLLGRHKNLWIDLSWSVLDHHILNKNKHPKDEWLQLIEKFPSRFMIGSDVVGKFRNQGKAIKTFDRLLSRLNRYTRENIQYNNFFEVLSLPQQEKN